MAGPQRVQVKPQVDMDKNTITGKLKNFAYSPQLETARNTVLIVLFQVLGGIVLSHLPVQSQGKILSSF